MGIGVAAMLVSIMALVISTGGWSVAGIPKEDKGEVEVLTVATGTFTTPGQDGELALSDASFTQEAGTSILGIVSLDGEIPPLESDDDVPCSFTAFVGVSDAFGVSVDRTNGGLFDHSSVEGSPAVDEPVARTIEASMGSECDTDGVTVELTVQIVALR
jgi:hypothetical protein